jgi:hypothetical protein
MLLFCIASGTDWQKAGVTGETVTVMVVKGLIERDAAGSLSLTGEGRAALGALLKDASRSDRRLIRVEGAGRLSRTPRSATALPNDLSPAC